jgi:hypothetical protein
MATASRLPEVVGEADYLEEDPEIPTQRYAILSFLSPEKILKQKSEFFNEKFVEWLDYDWKIKGIEHLLAYISKKYSIKVDDLFKDAEDFKKVHNAEVKKTDIKEQYQVFLLKHEKEIETEFSEKVDFQTNVRGVKLRRVFADLGECQKYAQTLQRRYPKDSLYVGKVGTWLPWDPSEHLMPEVEYAEKELNELMRKYRENEVNREIFFEEEKTQRIEKQKRENAAATAAGLTLKDLDAPIHPAEGGPLRDE